MIPDLRERLQQSLGGLYVLERELGGGGMSRVFLAEETRLKRRVVVKVFVPELAAGFSAQRFERELQVTASLQQANIVPVLAAGEAAGLPYYTMPYVDGESLRARLAERGALPIGEAVGVLRDVARALVYAHARGVVHRDIKPDNVLLSGATAVVTDFGIAKALAASMTGDSATSALDSTLTQIGVSLGTPAYMAPEQAAADPETDHRADIYAFGVLAYELLAGRPPFQGRTPSKLLAAQLSEQPKPIARLRPDAPAALSDLLMRCLEKDPDHRPQSAAELAHSLETVVSGGEHASMPALMPTAVPGGRWTLRRALVMYAVAFGAVALLARATVIALGVPDWVFPGALIAMAPGLPVILVTAFAHHAKQQAITRAATLTPGRTAAPEGKLATLAIKASHWLSWRKTALGGAWTLSLFGAAVVGFTVLRAFGIGPAGSLLAAGKVHKQERLIVTDFRARGADSSLGSVLSEAVRADLGQSGVVSVVPTSDVEAAMSRMERPATSRVDLALARGIAVREGVRAIVDGDVTPVGSGFLITLRLVTADSGNELASFRETADGPNELLPALDRLARRLRGKIGESLKTVRESPPLERVTTSSLEALRKYTAGSRANDVGDVQQAVALLQGAVELDTGFAEAWRKLGAAMSNAGIPRDRVNDAYSRAYRHRDRLVGRERDLAVAAYFDAGPGRDRRLAAAAYESMLARDPTDGIARNNLAWLLFGRREFARAESLLAPAIQSNRAVALEYPKLYAAQLNQGKISDASATMDLFSKRYPHGVVFGMAHADFLYVQGKVDSAAAVLERAGPGAAHGSLATSGRAEIAIVRGQLARGLQLMGDANAMNRELGAAVPTLEDSLAAAWVDIWFREKPERGVARLDATLARTTLRALSPTGALFRDRRPYYFRAAELYAVAGRPQRARALLARYDADVTDTAQRRDEEPNRHNALGEIALAEARPRDALIEFRRGDSLPDGPAPLCGLCVYARLGRAFDRAGMPDSALAMFERFATTPYFERLAPETDPTFLAGVYKRLGELYEAKGDRAAATHYYTRFVDLWRDADPDLQPKVADVRRRVARLSDTEAHELH